MLAGSVGNSGEQERGKGGTLSSLWLCTIVSGGEGQVSPSNVNFDVLS